MKITIYELLGMVKDGKAPKNIKYMGYKFEYDTNHKRYESYFDEQIWTLNDFVNVDDSLNDEVEIIEEEKKTKPLTKKNIEALGYACGEIQKCFTNGWTKSLENKPLEEEKKIPEKLKIEQDKPGKQYYIRNEYGTKCGLTQHSKMIVETLNQLIDYLKIKENKYD